MINSLRPYWPAFHSSDPRRSHGLSTPSETVDAKPDPLPRMAESNQSEQEAPSGSVCLKGFRHSYDVKTHIKTRALDPKQRKRYECAICHSKFLRQRYLNRHSLVHTNDRPHACGVCDSAFKSSYGLTRHIRAVLEGQKEQYIKRACTVCPRQFNCPSLLARHMIVHTKECPFKCQSCDQVFENKSKLNSHRKLDHEVKRPRKSWWTCSICHKPVRHMTNHKRIHHLNQKAFSCAKCGRSFKLRHGLVTHMVTHEDRRPFACQICGQKFETDRPLKVHQSRHRSTETYTCGIHGCKKESLTSYDLAKP